MGMPLVSSCYQLACDKSTAALCMKIFAVLAITS